MSSLSYSHELGVSVSNVPKFYREISAISLGFFTSQEIEQLSVVEIDFPVDRRGTAVASSTTIEGGLYDLRLGPAGDENRCGTCGQDFHHCPGHFGHINLPTVMYNPAVIKELLKLLKASCWVCNRFKCSVADVERFAQKFALLDAGDISGYFELEEQDLIMRARKARETELRKAKALTPEEEQEFQNYTNELQSQIQEKLSNLRQAKQHNTTLLELRRQLEKSFFAENNAPRKCHSCKAPQLKPKAVENGAIYRRELNGDQAFQLSAMGFDLELNMVVPDKEKLTHMDKRLISQKLVFPYVAKQLIQKLFENERAVLKYLYGHVSRTHDPVRIRITPDAFFFEKLLVTPPLFRPLQRIQDKHLADGVNTLYTNVVVAKHEIQDYLKTADADNNKLAYHIDKLQKGINAMFDRPHNKETGAKGLVQIIDKKKGLIRGHMMGKRVNFAGRTVLTPDVLLNTNQIGIPLYFAQRLSIPEPVTFRNFSEMAERVINGPDKYPGANLLEDSKGFLFNLAKMTEEERISHSKLLLSKGGVTIVHRHIKDGDVVLVNRQPTLHKPSIMAHYVKVLKVEKTLRLHYANCATFNADFDGDEMNVHVPQSTQARAEADQIVMADYQYLTLRHGGPLRGLIQDHILMGVFLTKRDTFLNQEQFQQLIYSTCMEINFEHPLEIPPPCIIKPQRLWSGKQAITAVINQITYGKPKINLDSKAKVPEDLWGKGSGEADLIIRDNELLCGVLDKNQFGATAFGLIHAVYELLGARVAGQLLSSLSRLFTMYLAGHAFTCGMDDLTLTSPMEAIRKKQLLEANNKGIAACQQFTGEKEFDPMMTKQAQLLSVPGADKQLDGLVKQQVQPVVSKLVDTCIPHGATKKWPYNNMAMMTITGAKGSTVNFSQISCLLGQQELEGKRVPRMISGRTLPSFEPYDPKARAGGFIADRFLTGLKPQEYFFHCMAGREGLIDTAVKTSRSGYLQRCLIKHLEGIQVHYDLTVRDGDGSVIQFLYGEDGMEVSKTKFLDKFSFLARNTHVLNETNPHFLLTTGGLDMKAAKKFIKDHPETPVLSELDPFRYVGAISEAYQNKINQYIEKNPDGLLSNEKGAGIKPAAFEKLMHLKYMKALVHPGEPVGVVAGQCIGEPSTQMTLNTFHLAGRGDVNVTLGIPRLRELLMVASKQPSTPSMTLPLIENSEAQGQKALTELSQFTFFDLVESIAVTESTLLERNHRYRIYKTHLQLKSEAELKKFNVTKKNLRSRLRVFLQFSEKSVIGVLRRQFNINVGSKLAQPKGAFAKSDENLEDTEDIDEESSKKKKVSDNPADEEDEESSADEDEEGNDKWNNKRKEEDEFDDDEEEAEQPAEEKDESDDDDNQPAKNKAKKAKGKQAQQAGEEDKEETNHLIVTEDMDIEGVVKGMAFFDATDPTSLVHRFGINYDKMFVEIIYKIPPLRSRRIMMLSILEDAMRNCYYSPVKGVKKCYLGQDSDKRYQLVTEGCNLQAVWEHRELFDVNRITTNHVYQVLQVYGVEAARNCVIKEIATVFSVYGIAVDYRHLSLIADYMTFHGDYKPMNRIGMQNQTSPWQRISFETSISFLTNAALHGDIERLKSPSAALVVGKQMKLGTGICDCIVPLNIPQTQSQSEPQDENQIDLEI